MSTPIQLPVANFSRDLRTASRAAAAAAGLAVAGALIAMAVLLLESHSYGETAARMAEQTGGLAAQARALRGLETPTIQSRRS